MNATGTTASVSVWSAVRPAWTEPKKRTAKWRHRLPRESEAEGRRRRRMWPAVPEPMWIGITLSCPAERG